MDAINFFAMHKIKIKRMHFYRQFIASSESYLQSAVLSLMINRNLIEKSWIREFKHRLKLHWKYDECTIMSISLKIKVLLKHMFCVCIYYLWLSVRVYFLCLPFLQRFDQALSYVSELHIFTFTIEFVCISIYVLPLKAQFQSLIKQTLSLNIDLSFK